jgi:hypothetical protein
MSYHENRAVVALVRDIMEAAIQYGPEKAGFLVRRLHDEHGPDSVMFALCAWCDLLVHTFGEPPEQYDELYVMVTDDDGNPVTEHPDPVHRERIARATRFILGRVRMRHDEVDAALHEVRDDLEFTWMVQIVLGMTMTMLKQNYRTDGVYRPWRQV